MDNYGPTQQLLDELKFNTATDADDEYLRWYFPGDELEKADRCMIVDTNPHRVGGINKIALCKRPVPDGFDEDVYTAGEVEQFYEDEAVQNIFFGWVPTEQALRDVMAYTRFLEA